MSLLLLTLEVTLISTLTSVALAAANQDHSFVAVGPPMIAAVGTVAAFLVTFALFWRGSKDRVREQASSVYATLAKEGETVTAVVHNASPLPIWHVEARPLLSGRLFEDDVPQQKSDLAPGESASFPWQGQARVDRDWRIRFIDAADRTWIRIGNKLVRDDTLSARARSLVQPRIHPRQAQD
jgi:hypothetical protein